MLRYLKCLIVQLLESVACNSLHNADQRVSRWLLEAHDRIAGNTLQVTQEALSQALGLRRATVNAVCTKLMDEGAIHYARGELSVLSDRKLKRHSCECYGRIRRNFEKGAHYSFKSSD
jgi:CRP-like cAMP-binding protein